MRDSAGFAPDFAASAPAGGLCARRPEHSARADRPTEWLAGRRRRYRRVHAITTSSDSTLAQASHISDIAELCDAQVEVSLLEPGRILATLT